MRYLVAAWAILALLILAIHLIFGAGNDTIVVPSGDVYRAMPGPPVGVVVDATPTPTPVRPSSTVPMATPTPMRDLPRASPTPAPSQVIERQELANLVHATFPDDPHMGNSVVWSEALFDPVKWRGYVYGGEMSVTGDCGLLQINWESHAEKFAAHGWTQQDCFDPVKNLIIAREIYDTSGPWAWTTY